MFIPSKLTQALKLYQAGEEIFAKGTYAYELLVDQGKERIGEFTFKDRNRRSWEIRIRQTGTRGRYLKIGPTIGWDHRFMVDGYKPHKYPSVEEIEWFICANYSRHQEDVYLADIQNMMDRLQEHLNKFNKWF